MTDDAKSQSSLHLAMTFAGRASQYLAMAWAIHPTSHWSKDEAIAELAKTAEALGYKLVKADAPAAAPDALDAFVNRVNAMALGFRS